ncbi:MAG: AMP-binding protein [Betaproteobacteria bacterium]|nr:AMP-binding protein [Betaproteobacteria bacterium]
MFTYAAFERTVDALAFRLRAAGIGPGDTVALFVRIPLRFCVAALALARLGVAFAPEMPAGRRAQVALVDGDDARAAAYPRVLALADSMPDAGAEPQPIPMPMPLAPDAHAVLMHCPTSGTTGGPRYTPVSHDLALRRLALRALTLSPLAGTRGPVATRQACLVAPGSWFGFSTVLRVLWGGGTVVQLGLDLDSIAARVATSGVTWLVASPIVVQRMAEALDRNAPIAGLEVLEVGGGALPAGVAALAQQRLCRNIVVAYGTSETGAVASAPLARVVGKRGAAGYPYLGVAVEIVDDADRPVATGGEGHVRIRSEFAATAYVDDPEGSAQVFRGGWVPRRRRGTGGGRPAADRRAQRRRDRPRRGHGASAGRRSRAGGTRRPDRGRGVRRRRRRARRPPVRGGRARRGAGRAGLAGALPGAAGPLRARSHRAGPGAAAQCERQSAAGRIGAARAVAGRSGVRAALTRGRARLGNWCR